MSDLKSLIAQREAIDLQIQELSKQERSEAVSKARALIADNGLTREDLFGGSVKTPKAKTPGTKVAAKYRDPVSGKEWSGRGIAPKWMAGQDKATFLIPDAS